jgi:uncharacterized membrane protein YdjX (TVP38/TMEM64 family)
VGASAIELAAGVLSSILPLALNGETVSEGGGNGTLLGVISLVSIIAGYLVLFALWRWFFSPNARKRRRKGSSE